MYGFNDGVKVALVSGVMAIVGGVLCARRVPWPYVAPVFLTVSTVVLVLGEVLVVTVVPDRGSTVRMGLWYVRLPAVLACIVSSFAWGTLWAKRYALASHDGAKVDGVVSALLILILGVLVGLAIQVVLPNADQFQEAGLLHWSMHNLVEPVLLILLVGFLPTLVLGSWLGIHVRQALREERHSATSRLQARRRPPTPDQVAPAPDR